MGLVAETALDPAPAAVPVPCAYGDPSCRAGRREDRRLELCQRLPIVRMCHRLQSQHANLIGGVAEQRGDGGADIRSLAIGAQQHHALRPVLNDRAETLLARPQRLFSALAIGDIGYDQHQAPIGKCHR